jgi:hypothetical protein
MVSLSLILRDLWRNDYTDFGHQPNTSWAFYASCVSALCILNTPVTDPSPIDPRAISLLDEHRYAGQHIHDTGNSLLADE